MCLSKVRFPDEYVARARIGQLFDQGRPGKRRLWVYRCPNCRGFHMTSAARYGGRGQTAAVTATDLYADDRPRARR